MKNFFQFFLCMVVAGTTLISCSSDDKSGETANFTVKLVDAPGEYDNVFVNVQGIEVIVDGQTHEFPVVQPGQYDLLQLTGGNFASLLNEQIPAGRLSQIRLILGADGNQAVIDGQVVNLKTPSAQQSGLKLNVHYDLQPGVTYDFVLDFNVHESIVQLGAAQGYVLKPVIRVTTEAESGAIAGTISPAQAATVTATDGETVVTAETDSETGAYLLYGVPAGTYSVVIENEAAETKTVTDVVVEIGITTQMDTVNF